MQWLQPHHILLLLNDGPSTPLERTEPVQTPTSGSVYLFHTLEIKSGSDTLTVDSLAWENTLNEDLMIDGERKICVQHWQLEDNPNFYRRIHQHFPHTTYTVVHYLNNNDQLVAPGSGDVAAATEVTVNDEFQITAALADTFRQDMNKILSELQHNWLKEEDILGILTTEDGLLIAYKVLYKPESGRLILYTTPPTDDGYQWVLYKEHSIKVDGLPYINYSHSFEESDVEFCRRVYVLSDSESAALVHYLKCQLTADEAAAIAAEYVARSELAQAEAKEAVTVAESLTKMVEEAEAFEVCALELLEEAKVAAAREGEKKKRIE